GKIKTQNTKRFFSEQSFWNQPIPQNAEIDPRSGQWIEMLKQEPTREYFGINMKQYAIPVYEADANTPLVYVKYHYLSAEEKKVWVTHNDRARFGHGPDFNPVPIPEGARPDPETDAHFCVVDWNRKLAWDMWGLRQLADGSWESNTGMVYRLDGAGVFDGFELGYIDGESVHFHGPSRAAGVPAPAGLIRYDEVMAGEIRHKLSCATRYAAYKEFVYPASWTDGFVEGGIPEGAIIQLDPKLDLSLFDLTPQEMVVARALQVYGMVVVDVAQGQPIYAEGLYAHPDKSWEGKLRDWDGGINAIPYDHYRILKIENPQLKGDERSRKNGSYWSENQAMHETDYFFT
ncbi:hypothetical protein L0128_12050, partial [candidate division KSB1 bacterium]|nr:hypothetical protein [candidate division KSB1 bacterium]